MAEKIEMTEAEWRAEGKRRFGPDMLKWKFCCPVCKHVASPEDFRAFKEQGATPDSATCECLGRYFPKKKRGGFSEDHSNPKVKQPCDYAGYGFFRLSPVEVTFPDGSKHTAFAFADEATGSA